jgi:hypothetical protein
MDLKKWEAVEEWAAMDVDVEVVKEKALRAMEEVPHLAAARKQILDDAKAGLFQTEDEFLATVDEYRAAVLASAYIIEALGRDREIMLHIDVEVTGA